MRITQYTHGVVKATGAQWRTGSEIAKEIGAKADNLITTFRKLVGAGILEENRKVSPIMYRRHPYPSMSARKLIEEIEEQDALDRVRSGQIAKGKADPARQEAIKHMVGYCAIIYPDQDFWQGFILTQGVLDHGQEVLTKVRSALSAALKSGGPEGLSEMDEGTTTITPAEGLAPADHPVLGTLCSSAATIASGAGARIGVGREHQEGVGPLLGAIAAITDKRYFIIRATTMSGGINTTFEPVPGTIIAMGQMMGKGADEVMHSIVRADPEVEAIERRVLKQGIAAAQTPRN